MNTKDKVHEEEEVKEEDKDDDVDASPIGAKSEKTDISVY